jgi:nitrite reductase/ring-hydroxylating ferredoxin subunit
MARGRYVVGPVADLPPGSITIVPVGKFGVGVFNVKGQFYALTNYCPHRGAPLCRGRITGVAEAGSAPYEVRWAREGEVLRCPWHGWEFEIASGTACLFPEKGIKTYPVTVEDEMVVLEGV